RPGKSAEQFPRGDDLDAEGFFQRRQIFVPRDDDVGFRCQRACEVRIVLSIAATLFAQGSGPRTIQNLKAERPLFSRLSSVQRQQFNHGLLGWTRMWTNIGK